MSSASPPTDLSAAIHRYLTTAPASLFASGSTDSGRAAGTLALSAPWSGDDNLLWRISAHPQEAAPHTDAVLKLFLDAGQARSRRQHDAHQIMAPIGLAPHPLWADRYPTGLARQIIVYRWADGAPPQRNAPDDLTAWAEAVARIHTTPTDDVRRFSPHPFTLDTYWRIEQASLSQISPWLAPSRLPLVPVWDTLCAAAQTAVTAGLPLWEHAPPTPVHGDLRHAHTLLHRGQVVLLDWEMFGLGDPALDVARLLQREQATLGSPLGATQATAWQRAYLAAAPLPNLAPRIELYSRLLALHNVVYLLGGLQQHLTTAQAAELRVALPDLGLALTQSLTNALAAFALVPDTAPSALITPFMDWLHSQLPTT